MYQVIQYLQQDLDIRLEWPVRTVNYEKDAIVLTSIHGETIEASKVVIAVPLPVLKDGTYYTGNLPNYLLDKELIL